MNRQNLKLTICTSFLGSIAKNVRAIAFDFTDSTVLIYGYLEEEPIDKDYEIIDLAVTEIMATYPRFLYQNISLEKSNQPISQLPFYKGWIFCRYEE